MEGSKKLVTMLKEILVTNKEIEIQKNWLTDGDTFCEFRVQEREG